MDTPLLVAAVVVVVLVAVGAWWYLQRQKRERLRSRFGAEYDRTLREVGDARKAEAVLEQRQKRVAGFDLRPLSSEDSGRFAEAWRRVQSRFVDDPRGAVTEADGLVADVMGARGYPVADFEQRAADLSVAHGPVVEHYRAARVIAVRHARGEAGTEDLRQAMVHYRALFEDLLETETQQRRGGNHDRRSRRPGAVDEGHRGNRRS
jgi:hypothetical protein